MLAGYACLDDTCMQYTIRKVPGHLDIALRRRAQQQGRSQGTPIPTGDMWIAALVLHHSLVLFARDTHLAVLPQITRA